ncbi:PKD domain-containing protein [Halorarius halobius]|uniref:PKD domain-containing protein n=1 Tax=Halorarius halobius TaxID=2962671 RepID=UPI0020CE3E53|nr:PKD domain-containing protein [Halorarius halobius]
MDTRGQSIQVGAIILFGFLVIAFSAYQASIVPQQNEEVEFQHSQDVAEDMQQLRNDVVEAGTTGTTRTASVRLGTTYPPRTFASNPNPASGSLRAASVGSGEISLDAPGANIESICGYDKDGDDAVPSRSLVYEPNYHVYQYGQTVVYENSVVYRQNDDGVVLDSGQTLITGNQIRIPALIGEYQRAGTTMVSVDVAAGKTGVGTTANTGATELTVPSTLGKGEWETLLAGELQANGGNVTGITDNGDTVTFALASAEYDITCPVVGAGTTPSNQPANVKGEAGGINPSASGDVRLSDVERHTSPKDVIVLSFTNPGDEVNLSQARFNFYQASTDDGPDQLDLSGYDLGATSVGTTVVSDLQRRGAPDEPSPNLTFTGGGSVTAVALRYEDSTGSIYSPAQDDISVVNLVFSDGQEANYFVNVPKQGTTVSNDAPTADFTYSTSFPNTVDVDGGASSDPDGSISTYEWDWTSNGGYDPSGQTVSHMYTNSGSYDITLRVTDNAGATDTVTKTVAVTTAGSVPGFSSASATDLAKNQMDTQTITFRINQTLNAGETVSINLDAPQSVKTNGQINDVDYRSGSGPSVTGGGGSATLSAGRETASITYSPPPSGLPGGTQVSLSIEAETKNGGPYTIQFSRSDGSGTETATFTIN